MGTEIHNNSTSKFSKSSEVQSRPKALKVSPFGRLSTGVIRLIAWYLPPASKLAFRHSCLHIYSVTATQRLNSVREKGLIERRTPPWEVLELEHPNHVECYRCRALHPTDKIHEHAYFNPRPKRDTSRQHNFFSPKCHKINREVRAEIYIHPNFCFTVFRMLMKQYRQGKDCEKLLNLLAHRGGVVMEGAQIKQVIATPKIVGGRLLMRLQTACLVQPRGPSQTYLITGNLLKCPHTDRWSRDNRILTEALYERFQTLDTVPGDRQEHVMSCRCPFCPTEFHFGLQQFKGQGVVLFSTKWQDLGTGLSPLEADLPPIVGRHKSIPVARSREPLDYESPRHRFEGLAPGEGFRAVSALEEEEREELFRKNNSRRAKYMRSMILGAGLYMDLASRIRTYMHQEVSCVMSSERCGYMDILEYRRTRLHAFLIKLIEHRIPTEWQCYHPLPESYNPHTKLKHKPKLKFIIPPLLRTII